MEKYYSRVQMYWFSGTGNSKRIGEWALDATQKLGFHGVSHSIISYPKGVVPSITHQSLIGFCSPTHGFNFPPVMLNFLLRFPKNTTKSSVFLMNARAGLMLNRWFIPGVSGVALLFAAVILMIKGYRIVGMRSVDLPSNWISLHPGVRDRAIIRMHDRCERKVRRFMESLLQNRRVYRALLDLPIDLLISPVAIGYYFVGRFFFSKSFMASNSCDNCGLCYAKCPVKAIRLVNGMPYWTWRCESCMQCMNKCPKRAIETAHGFVFGVVYLVNIVIGNSIARFLQSSNMIFPAKWSWLNGINSLILESLLFLIALIIAYRVVHYLKQHRFVARLLEYTSFTRFGFWNRYQPEKLLKKQ